MDRRGSPQRDSPQLTYSFPPGSLSTNTDGDPFVKSSLAVHLRFGGSSMDIAISFDDSFN